ncbi:DUF3298 and DUF4163 domain-containing protein [Bacillus sp. CLL-7-23]|uniref:DUF3298 and DUF4163 domain-containing protein n=1 Tax=Bacillus changyiensis TaxID=3004103 RepID=A0ABT4X1D2_9BACI|nr:DUF3298 and DUF4163 domain-containing protein [Bacillus changyiensis]MDA7025207.1 DUF3298 and DUF4163 domain-containing protein [Bacillus changyiensis]
MSKKSCFSLLVIGFLWFMMFAGMAPLSAQAANNNKPIVTSHIYQNLQKLKYPQVKNIGNKTLQTKMNQDFNKYIEQSYQDYLKNKQDGEKHGYKTDYQTSFHVKYATGQRLSILTENYVFSGGAHGLTAIRSFNYDLELQKRIYLTDLLNTASKIEKTKDYIFNYIQKHHEIFFPDVKKKDIVLNKETAFYYTKTGIAIVFQQYDVAPYAVGNPVVHVPKSVYR